MKITKRYFAILFVAISGVMMADDESVPPPPPSPSAQLTADVQDWPLSVDAAVARLISQMSDEVIARFRSLPERELIRLHHSLGRAIRNQFGLWKGNEALLKDTGESEPDAASMVIIKALWKQLNQKNEPNQ